MGHTPSNRSNRTPRTTSRRYATWRGSPTRTDASRWRRTTDDLDLRRARDRTIADTIVDRAALLRPDERWLLESIYLHGRTLRDLAEETGIPPRTIASTVRRLSARVLSEVFAFVASRRDGWDLARKRVATLVIIRGYSMRQAADELRLSLHTVRRHMAAVSAGAEAVAIERRAETQRIAEHLARLELGV